MTTVTMLQLSPLITAAVTKTAAGERAVKAAAIVLEGKITRLADVDGQDRWAVQGSAGVDYEVSIKGGMCQCADAEHKAPRTTNGAPLCKHMLAAMYLTRLGVSRSQTAGELFAKLAADGQTLRLFVRIGMTGHVGTGQRDEWIGYRTESGRTDLAEPLDVSMHNHEFWAAVEAAGYRKAGQSRSQAGAYLWTMEPAPVAVVDWPQPVAADDTDTDLWK